MTGIDVTGLDRVTDEIRGRMRDLRPANRRNALLYRQSMGQEFRQESYFRARSGVLRWRKTKPFGTRRPPANTLQRSGKLLAAVEGKGPGSLLRVGKRTFSVGVKGNVVPYAASLRGGTGHDIDFRPRIIRPKKRVAGRRSGPQQFAMWWALFYGYGVTLSMATLRRGLRLPVRPWGGVSRRLVDQWSASYRNFISTGDPFGRRAA